MEPILDGLLAEYVQRICGHDQEALGLLYEATIARVHALAARIVANAEAAEEVVSDVYLQAWRDATRYEASRGPVQAWLLVICRSRALDALRRRDPAELHPEPANLIDQANGDNDPEALVMALERRGQASRALARLSPLQRQLVALAFFRGYTHREIAASSRLPLGTVKTHLRDALSTMRKSLASTLGAPRGRSEA